MSDLSPFSLEERILMSVWVHERDRTGKSLKTLFEEFRQRFNKQPPSKPTVLNWERKMFKQGIIKDCPRSGRRRTRDARSQEIVASVERFPLKSLRKRSAEMNIPRASLHRHLKLDKKMHAYRPMSVNELTDEDMDRRRDACNILLQTFPDLPSRGKVFFSDECAVYRSSRRRNAAFAGINCHMLRQMSYQTW